jgi:squalene synthase HpnC
MSIDHYENFPVASILLPRHMRRPVEAIYAFARSADDFADEGDLQPAQRLALLNGYVAQLDLISTGETPVDALFSRISSHIKEYNLPLTAFYDLLNAFSQDVVKPRYANYAEVLDYCARSANPVGRLMLHLHAKATPENLQQSDAICSALQIINFLQDIGVDWQKDRIYMPQDELARFKLSDAAIANSVANNAASNIASFVTQGEWPEFMRFQVQRTRALLLAGKPLAKRLGGRFGFELRFVIAGGATILDKIDAVNGDIFKHRPVMRKRDWLKQLTRIW